MKTLLSLIVSWLSACLAFAAPPSASYDVVVYGATPAGVTAAVAAGRTGHKVLLLEPAGLVGGMMSGGLTKTDITRRENCGGLSLETFKRIESYYAEKYGADSAQVKESHGGIYFEPHVAGEVFARMLKEAGVEVRTQQRLSRTVLSRNAIVKLVLVDAKTAAETIVEGRIFVDGTYEGDLMADAGVPYRVGREGRDEWNELLAGLTAGPEAYLGKGDHKAQAYNYRSTLTNRDEVRLPIPKPERYRRETYAGYVESVRKHGFKTFEDLFPDSRNWGMVNGKADPNKGDAIGFNAAYSEGDWEQRARIGARMRDHWLGLWWTLQNDPELPEAFKASARKWGLPKDEFVDNGHVSPQIYVREARRMLGSYHLTQRDVELLRQKDDTICLGRYNMDCHEVQVLQTPEGRVSEGGFIEGVDPYEIPYRVLTPVAPTNLLVVCAVSATHVAYSTLRMEPCFMMLGQAGGFAAHLALVHGKAVQEIPVSELQDHLRETGVELKAPYRPAVEIGLPSAEGPLPVGQPVRFHAKPLLATAPIKEYYWNFDGSGSVQSTEKDPTVVFKVSKRTLVSLICVDEEGRKTLVDERLVEVGQPASGDPRQTVLQADVKGFWARAVSHSEERRFRNLYQDRNEEKGGKSVTFSATPGRSGRYIVSMAYRTAPGRASNVPVRIEHADGVFETKVDQRKPLTPFALAPLGEFRFEAGKTYRVTVGNAGTDGLVTLDEIRWSLISE